MRHLQQSFTMTITQHFKKKKKKSARSAAKSLDCGVSMTMLF